MHGALLFALGVITGGAFGVVTMCLIVAAHDADADLEELYHECPEDDDDEMEEAYE